MENSIKDLVGMWERSVQYLEVLRVKDEMGREGTRFLFSKTSGHFHLSPNLLSPQRKMSKCGILFQAISELLLNVYKAV